MSLSGTAAWEQHELLAEAALHAILELHPTHSRLSCQDGSCLQLTTESCCWLSPCMHHHPSTAHICSHSSSSHSPAGLAPQSARVKWHTSRSR